jgi:uncharacterized protein (DUF2336 family)
MMVRAYLEWSAQASAQERADAVGILADLFLEAELDAVTRREAEAALVLALDDPAPCVRLALAARFAASDRAPRAVISALAQDPIEIAAPVIARSPLLPDAALVDLLALGDEAVQCAVAQRDDLSPAVGAALAEVGQAEAVAALLENESAALPVFALRRIVERFPSDGGLRGLLLERGDLPADIRLTLVRQMAGHLARFVEDRGWLSAIRAERLERDCAESGAIALAAMTQDDEVAALAAALFASDALTPQLLLRSLLCGETRLLVEALAQLAGVSPAKASGLVHARGGAGFGALYRKAGLPPRFAPAFEAALSALREGCADDARPGALASRIIERVLTSVAALDDSELDRLMALLLRYQAEAVREEARAAVAAMRAQPLAPPVEHEADDLDARLRDALLIEFKEAA